MKIIHLQLPIPDEGHVITNSIFILKENDIDII